MSTATFHILVGIDFSDSSNLAIQHALRLGGAMGARLHLAHIVTGEGLVADTNLGMNIPGDFPAAKESRASLQRLLGQLGANVDGEIHVRLGTSPLAGLQSLITELKPDFVIVGSHGRGLLHRALLGSVSHQLAERSPVPVMIIPTPGREEALRQPEPPAEPELPAVGRPVADSEGGSSAFGIGSVGGSDVHYR